MNGMKNWFVGVLAVAGAGFCAGDAGARPPNIVVILADDLGYGDVNCFYPKTKIRTPHLDKMADQGMRFTQFYATAAVCSPTRAALLTGRYGARTGMFGVRCAVLGVDSRGGMPLGETTLPEALKARGYATACIGKWHLGHHKDYWPTRHGFDEFFGILFANNQYTTTSTGKRFLHLYSGKQIVEWNVYQPTLTRRITDRAIGFIKRNRQRPFFLYLPYTAAHTPLFASQAFAGRSPAGTYGDVVEEMDYNIGRVLKTLRDLNLDDNTLVVFTSDNGPATAHGEDGGSSGPFRGGKGDAWEGSVRAPTIAWWPGRIRKGTVSRQVGNSMDLFSTSLALAGIAEPSGRVIDGRDLRPVLFGNGTQSLPVQTFFYGYRGGRPVAARKGPWKLHVERRIGGQMTTLAYPLLYNLNLDRAETTNVAAAHPDIVAEMKAEIAAFKQATRGVRPEFDR